MRYSLQAVMIDVAWDSKEAATDWEPLLHAMKSIDPNGDISYNPQTQTGGFTLGSIKGNFDADSLSATIPIEAGTRRASTLKKIRDFIAPVASAVPDVHPFVEVDLRARTKIAKNWAGPVRNVWDVARSEPWIDDQEELDFVAVRYYVRHPAEKLFVKLDLTPGFVKDTELLVRLEVFHPGGEPLNVASFSDVINKVLDFDIPKLLGGVQNGD